MFFVTLGTSLLFFFIARIAVDIEIIVMFTAVTPAEIRFVTANY